MNYVCVYMWVPETSRSVGYWYCNTRVGGCEEEVGGAVVGICGGIRSVEGTEGYDVHQINIGSAIGKKKT